MSICSVNTQTGSKDLHSIRLLSSLTPSSWWLTVHAADGPTKKTHCTFHISYDSELIQPVWEVNSRTSSHKSSHRRAHRGNTADDWSRFLSLRTGVVSTHDEVCEVVLLIAVSMHFFFAVNWECVVVVLRVSHLWPWNKGGCNICVCECVYVCVCVCVCVSHQCVPMVPASWNMWNVSPVFLSVLMERKTNNKSYRSHNFEFG